MRGSAAAILLLLPAGLLGACAAPPCEGDRLVRLEAFMGGDVPEAAWRAFVEASLTPAFPNGLTVTRAEGQWRGPDGRLQREDARVVTILAPQDAAARFAPVAAAYRDRFAQHSVLVVTQPACARF